MAFPDLDNDHFQRNVDRLLELGSRVLYEILTELGRRTMHMITIEQVVERYARLDPDKFHVLGGDQFPPRPSLRLVGGHRHG
jgi:hypothetical protein